MGPSNDRKKAVASARAVELVLMIAGLSGGAGSDAVGFRAMLQTLEGVSVPVVVSGVTTDAAGALDLPTGVVTVAFGLGPGVIWAADRAATGSAVARADRPGKSLTGEPLLLLLDAGADVWPGG